MIRRIGRVVAAIGILGCMCVLTTSTLAYQPEALIKNEAEIQAIIEELAFEESKSVRDELINMDAMMYLDEQAIALVNAEREAIARNLGGGMAGQELFFYDKAIELGIDPVFAVALAAHETGNGSSYLCINNHNFGGMRGQGGWMQFKDKETGILTYLNLLVSYHSRGLDTPEKMVSRYAPNSPTWVGVVRGYMARINRDIEKSRAEVNAYYASLASQLD